MQPIRSGEWLIFVDAQYPTAGTPYRLRALNVVDRTEQTLIENTDGKVSLPWFDAEEEWAVWTVTRATENFNCTETVLAVHNLENGQSKELEDSCAEETHIWSFPKLSGNYLVVEQDLPDARGSGNNIYLYDLSSATLTALTADGHSSEPDISGLWVVWKDAPRFSEAQRTVLYNIQSQERQVLNVGYDFLFLSDERWLYWQMPGSSPIAVYDLATKQLLQIAFPAFDEILGAVSIENNIIAWARIPDSVGESSNSVIEWRSLP